MPVTTPATRRNVMKIDANVYEVQRSVLEIQQTLKSREDNSGQNKAVGVAE